MATAIGVARIDLHANTAAFERNMGKAAKAVTSGSARMNKSLVRVQRNLALGAKKMKRFAGAALPLKSLIGGAVAGGLLLMTKRALDTADAIGKTADAIGISTDALQEYRFALDISGVAQETTDKGLKKFVRNMGELGRTSSETQTALQDLDPALLANLRSLNSVEDQLQAAFRAMAGYADQSKRVAVAAAFFGGRVGADMTVAIKKGAAAFEDLRQKAHDLGLIIDGTLIRGAETAKDKLTILSTVIKAKLTAAVVNFAPKIGALADTFTANIPRIAKWVESFARFVGLIDKSDVEKLADIEARIKFIGSGFTGFAVDLGLFDSLKKELVELEARKRALINPPPLKIRIGRSKPAPGGAAADPQFDKEKIAAAAAAQKFFIRQQAQAAALGTSTEGLKRQAAQLKRLTAALGRGGAEYRKLKNALDLQNEAARLNIDLNSKQGKAWEEAARQSQRAAQGLEDMRLSQEALAATAEEVSGVFDNFFNSAISGAARLSDSLKKLGLELLAVAAKQLISNQSGGGAGGGILSSLFGGFRKHGGGVSPGKAYVVGEQGPELFAPARQGSIIPNVSGGGVSVTYNIDARGADIGVEARIMAALELVSNSIEPRALNAIAFDRDHNGPTVAPLGG